jgi:hypothetical protein
MLMFNYKFKKKFIYFNEKKKNKITAVGNRWAKNATLLYQLKLALTSPAGCGLFVDIVRIRSKTAEFFFFYFKNFIS